MMYKTENVSRTIEEVRNSVLRIGADSRKIRIRLVFSIVLNILSWFFLLNVIFPFAQAEGISAAAGNSVQIEKQKESKPHGLMEYMHPDELELVLEKAPVVYVPLGTFEHHGFHLPVCFDGIKAHALCEKAAERTGGAVLPTFFYGTGGGHIGYKWTNIVPEEQITPLLAGTLDNLTKQGFKVIVMLTGHYPGEQTGMVKRLIQEAQKRHPQVKFLGLSEPEITTPLPGDTYAGDHAAKYETSIALALNPAWVQMDKLKEGRDPSKIVLPETPRKEGTPYNPTHPLYAIHGQDPRSTASREMGEKLVNEIVNRLVAMIEESVSKE